MNAPRVTDATIEQMLSVLLRAGVIVSGATVFAGGIYYLLRHANDLTAYRDFHSQPAIDRIPRQIVAGALGLRARSIIDLGILLLIATPILRVACSLVAFALERDRNYVIITSIVLAVLIYSLVSGSAAG